MGSLREGATFSGAPSLKCVFSPFLRNQKGGLSGAAHFSSPSPPKLHIPSLHAGAKPALLHSSPGLRYGLSSFLVPANSISARLQPTPAYPSFLLQSRSAYDAKRFILLPPARCRIRSPDHGGIAAVFDYHRPISGCAVIPMTPNLHLQETSNGTDHLQLFIIINIIYAV